MTDCTVIVEYCDEDWVTEDWNNNPLLTFVTVPVQTQPDVITVEVSGLRAQLESYIRDTYSEGDPTIAAEVIAAIKVQS